MSPSLLMNDILTMDTAATEMMYHADFQEAASMYLSIASMLSRCNGNHDDDVISDHHQPQARQHSACSNPSSGIMTSLASTSCVVMRTEIHLFYAKYGDNKMVGNEKDNNDNNDNNNHNNNQDMFDPIQNEIFSKPFQVEFVACQEQQVEEMFSGPVFQRRDDPSHDFVVSLSSHQLNILAMKTFFNLGLCHHLEWKNKITTTTTTTTTTATSQNMKNASKITTPLSTSLDCLLKNAMRHYERAFSFLQVYESQQPPSPGDGMIILLMAICVNATHAAVELALSFDEINQWNHRLRELILFATDDGTPTSTTTLTTTTTRTTSSSSSSTVNASMNHQDDNDNDNNSNNTTNNCDDLSSEHFFFFMNAFLDAIPRVAARAA